MAATGIKIAELLFGLIFTADRIPPQLVERSQMA